MARATRTGRRATRGTALLAGLAAVGLQPGAAGAQGARQDAQEAVVLDQLSVEGAGAAAAPRNGVVGPPPPAYPGGVVGSGSRLGLLGNRNLFDQPFSATSYTETLIRNQQARNVQDVVNNDPSVRTNVPAFSGILGFFVRGFPVFAQDMAFNGLFGVADNFNPAIEPIERVEVLRGPSTLLSGVPPFGNIGGLINLIPKRALDEPLTRVTLGYGSDAQVYKAIDVSRRWIDSDARNAARSAWHMKGTRTVPEARETSPASAWWSRSLCAPNIIAIQSR